MHLATKQHIIGMLAMIRTGCNSIEAALSSDEYYQKKKETSGSLPEPDSETFLTEEQENMVGQMLGLIPDNNAVQEAQKKTARKAVNERLSKSKDI